MNGPIPAVLYAAKSTEDTRGSIPTQLEDGRKMAEREDWEVVGEFSDEGKSAYHGNRGEGLEQAKAAAVAAAAEYGEAMLLVQHSDRLARGPGDGPDAADHLAEVYFWARRQNVRLRSVTDDDNLDDAIHAVLIGERNTEDSRRKSEAVTSGKDRQFERGERLGGPVPDGLVRRIERDDQDRIVGRRYVPDEDDRAATIRRLFDLSDEGRGDPSVSTKLNAEGHTTKSGGPWTRRRVQHTLLNPIYAGRIARQGRGSKDKYERLAEREVMDSPNVEALIDPDRYDRIIAARTLRDRVRPDKRKRGGRTTTRYVLAKLAICDRCGGRMYSRTSPYERKDKTHKRQYVCGRVFDQTGTCDQPKLDAEVIDRAVVGYLDRLFVDFDAWRGETERERKSARTAAQAALDKALAAVAKLENLAKKVQDDYLRQLDKGDDEAAQIAKDASRTVADRREAKQREVEVREAVLAEIDAPTDDTMLDVWNDLKRAVQTGDKSVGALNERLRAEFVEFRLDQDDEGTVGVLPVLMPRDVPDSPLALLQAWKEAGEPGPTDEEIDAYERDADRAGAEDLIVVPTKKLLIAKGLDTHE